MKLIKPTFEFIEQKSGIEGIYKQIELAGRICYKSEDQITETSAKAFTDRMVKSGHGAVLEHGTVYLYFSYTSPLGDEYYMKSVDNRYKYEKNKYSKVNTKVVDGYEHHVYVTTNLRVLVENNWMDDLEYLCEPTEYHEKRVTVKFTCDRVTGESFLRHRSIDEDHPTMEGEVTREMESEINSYMRESTRYCNYSDKKKFNNQFTIITPPEFYNVYKDTDILVPYGNTDDQIFKMMCWDISSEDIDDMQEYETWYFANLATQWAYNRLISLGWKPQQARRVIPLDIKSPLVMTAFVSDWEHFFNLRCEAGAHPQAKELAIPLRDEFYKRGYIRVIDNK